MIGVCGTHLFLIVPRRFSDEEVSVALQKADNLAAGQDAVEPAGLRL